MVALFCSAVFAADSPVDLEVNLPLTDDDIQLRTWILDLFKTIEPNHEYRMFLVLSRQEESYQYECHYMGQTDETVCVLPELAADPDVKI